MKAQFMLGDLFVSGNGVEKDEYSAYVWYTRSAMQGYLKAKSHIFSLHITDAKFNEFLEYCKAAAEQGDSGGQLYLGFMYFQGYGVECNKLSAIEWLKKSAEQNNK
jgi:TPR repeat protein